MGKKNKVVKLTERKIRYIIRASFEPKLEAIEPIESRRI